MTCLVIQFMLQKGWINDDDDDDDNYDNDYDYDDHDHDDDDDDDYQLKVALDFHLQADYSVWLKIS